MANLVAIASDLTGREINRITVPYGKWPENMVSHGAPTPQADLLVGLFQAGRDAVRTPAADDARRARRHAQGLNRAGYGEGPTLAKNGRDGRYASPAAGLLPLPSCKQPYGRPVSTEATPSSRGGAPTPGHKTIRPAGKIPARNPPRAAQAHPAPPQAQ
jgi:hypothetical protein